MFAALAAVLSVILIATIAAVMVIALVMVLLILSTAAGLTAMLTAGSYVIGLMSKQSQKLRAGVRSVARYFTGNRRR